MHVRYPALISCQLGVITVSVAQGSTGIPGATKQLLLPDRVLKELYIYIYIYIYIYYSNRFLRNHTGMFVLRVFHSC